MCIAAQNTVSAFTFHFNACSFLWEKERFLFLRRWSLQLITLWLLAMQTGCLLPVALALIFYFCLVLCFCFVTDSCTIHSAGEIGTHEIWQQQWFLLWFESKNSSKLHLLRCQPIFKRDGCRSAKSRKLLLPLMFLTSLRPSSKPTIIVLPHFRAPTFLRELQLQKMDGGYDVMISETPVHW